MATTFTFRQGGFDGERKVYTPTGFVRDRESNAVWGMQFIWPFKADFRIVYLDEHSPGRSLVATSAITSGSWRARPACRRRITSTCCASWPTRAMTSTRFSACRSAGRRQPGKPCARTPGAGAMAERCEAPAKRQVLARGSR